MVSYLVGIIFVALSGLFQASYATFMKYMGRWKWENFWLVWAAIALLIFPVAWSYTAVPQTSSVISAAPISAVEYALLFGFLWGIGVIAFGLSVIKIGVALTYSIVIGMTLTIGTIVPLFLGSSIAANAIYFLALGMAVVLASVVISGYAGSSREKKSGTFSTGLIIAIVSGILSPMLNVGFVLGSGISGSAKALGASAVNSTLPVWVVLLFAAFVINVAYVVYLMRKNRTYGLYGRESSNKFLLPLSSGLIWFGGIGLYGFATAELGSAGVSAGWGLLMSSMILISNIEGVLTGEWKKNKSAFRLQAVSIIVALVGVAMIAYALAIGA